MNTLKSCLEAGGSKLPKIQLKTFNTQNVKYRKALKITRAEKPVELSLLQNMYQVLAIGGGVNIQKMVWEHGCTDTLPSLFTNFGDFDEELKDFKRLVEVTEISGFFTEPFFETKKVVYLPVNK